MDHAKNLQHSFEVLQGIPSNNQMEQNDDSIPHFIVDANMDGVCWFNNSEQSECIPILFIIHSVAKSSEPNAAVRLLKPIPFIVGLFHGNRKPNAEEFMEATIAELRRLHKDNLDPILTKGRQFTVHLRCIRNDGPMRSYLKRCKGHSGYFACERCIQRGVRCEHGRKSTDKVGESTREDGKSTEKDGKDPPSSIQYRDLNAPLRKDEDFLSYVKENSADESDDHIPDMYDICPFYWIGFECVTGFTIEPMHTYTGRIDDDLRCI